MYNPLQLSIKLRAQPSPIARMPWTIYFSTKILSMTYKSLTIQL